MPERIESADASQQHDPPAAEEDAISQRTSRRHAAIQSPQDGAALRARGRHADRSIQSSSGHGDSLAEPCLEEEGEKEEVEEEEGEEEEGDDEAAADPGMLEEYEGTRLFLR